MMGGNLDRSGPSSIGMWAGEPAPGVLGLIYALLRVAAGVALRWFYRDIAIQGIDRVPRRAPVLLVVNHPNALVDALLVGWSVPRRVLMTAKGTLFRNPLAAKLLTWLGVVPLRRVSDERSGTEKPNPARNEETFRAVHHALRSRATVLIFPEGKSHDEPSMAQLKTGAARMALHARDAGDVPGLMIVPIGLTFERKERPRSRVFVQIGEPIAMDHWRAPDDGRPIEALTREIDARLRAVTLNYATADDAARAAALSSLVAALFTPTPSLGTVERPLSVEAGIARRIEALNAGLSAAGPELRANADSLVRRLDAFQRSVRDRGLLIEDLEIKTGVADGARFVLREGWLLAIAGPLALWGKLNHFLPFHAARSIAARSVESNADPAMRTIVAGAVLVTLTYVAQALVVGLAVGPLAAGAYVVSLPVAADLNFYLSERATRALERARMYRAFRADPDLQRALTAELETLRRDALSLDTALRERAATLSA